MRIIPSTVSLATSSAAEKKVFKILEEIDFPANSVCLHSLRLAKHQYKRSGEIDFLIVTNSGFYVLEVKGGAIGRDAKGIWTFTDRFGDIHKKIEGPFQQAESAMYSLKEQILKHFGYKSSFSNLSYGFGVVFPDCKFIISSMEWDAEMIIDRDKTENKAVLKKALSKFITYWNKKSKKQETVLNSQEFESLVQFLRPKFDLAPSIAYRVNELDKFMETLTNEQYEKFDAIEQNDRIICTGGAGTGKTFLGLEIARRHSERGNTVLFLVKSPILACYFQTKVDTKVCVTTPEKLKHGEEFDVLIIDEGQDLINFKDLSIIEPNLKAGFEEGIWRIFMDMNNQSGLTGQFEQAALDFLKLNKPVVMHLSRNCRNTKNIVVQTQLITTADIGIPTAGEGPVVVYEYVADDKAGLKILESLITSLLKEDVSPMDIMILSAVDFEESIVASLPLTIKRNITVLDELNSAQFPFLNIGFCKANAFKGMESKFVFLTDFSFNHFTEEGINTIYVSMTRAKAGLTFILPQMLKSKISELLIAGFEKIHNKHD